MQVELVYLNEMFIPFIIHIYILQNINIIMRPSENKIRKYEQSKKYKKTRYIFGSVDSYSNI